MTTTPIIPGSAGLTLSDAERARTIAASSSHGTLSTLAVDPAGHPFGSLVAFALEDDGSPLLLLSALAEHSGNLAADPRASLLVAEPGHGGDPLAGGRVTVLAEAELMADDAELDAIRQRYLDAVPAAALYVDFADFSFVRLKVVGARFVAGFGRMSWVDAAPYADASPDPVAPVAARIIEHMNADHRDDLLACCRAFGGVPAATAATLTGVDRHGIDAVVATPDGPAQVRLGYREASTTADAVRRELVWLTHQARQALPGS